MSWRRASWTQERASKEAKTVEEIEAAPATKDAEHPRGMLFTITPWKAALLGPFVDFTGLGSILPLLPFYVKDVGADELWVGAILSAQYTAVVIGSMFWGRVADYVGIRKVYIVLLVLDILFFSLSAVVTTVEGLLVCRFFAGFSAIMPLGTAWISASCPPEKMNLAFSLLVPSVLAGFIFGSAIGGAVGNLKTGVGVGEGGWFAAVMVSTFLVCAALFVIVFGTAPPPARKVNEEKPKPEGVKKVTLTVGFFACCLTSFLGSNEGGVMMVMISLVLSTEAPDGYAYSQAGVGLVFVCLASCLLVSSLGFAAFLDKRTHALQRIVLLGGATLAITMWFSIMTISWESNGLWTHGDKVYVASIIALFFFQCVVGPTAMTIAALSATGAKNADGTILGIQQAAMNAGQAVGPIIGGALYTVNVYAPFLYVACFEAVTLVLNIYVFYQGRRQGSVERSLFDLSKDTQNSSLQSEPDVVAVDELGTAPPHKKECKLEADDWEEEASI
jgi:MFS family permease